MFERAILVHYHEIGLKGRNRSRFENVLRRNIRAALAGLEVGETERFASRLLVRLPDHSVRDEALARLARVPGISYLADAMITGRDLAQMKKAAEIALREVEPWRTFRIEARRSNTDFPVPSMEINREVGQHIVDAFGRGVDLSEPEATCWIEVVQGDAYVYARRVEGPGGLPVGSGGRVVSLLSAGIDSPVATWRLIKRGAVAVGVHFCGAPQTDEASIARAHRVGEVLEKTGGLARIHSVRFGDVQKQVALSAPPALRVLLYRRLMVRVAERVAADEGALALVTGESLGQVASQTLDNIAVVDEAARLPVLRPLVGNDKVEIIEEARRIGTYEISIEPGDDCCTLFMPRMPATRATVEDVRAAEEALDIEALVSQAMGTITVREFDCPAYRPR
ncbi:MAG: tRNA 4-thiouridine(8) synthase ThiI [Coriobacteriia bacterium]